MKKIEQFWNGVYYCFYKLDYKMHLRFNHINPVLPIYKAIYSKERYEKMRKDFDKVFENKRDGLSPLRASAGIYILSYMLILAIINFSFVIRGKSIEPGTYVILACGVIILIINHLLLFHRDKYVKYFKEFSKLERKKKVRMRIINILFCFGIFGLLILSFYLAP